MRTGPGAGGARAAGAALALALALGAGAGCQPGPGAQPPGRGPEAEPTQRVYVANQDAGTVTVVDGEAHAVLATVDLKAMGYGTNPKPHHIAVEPGGRYWYVSLIGANRVLKLSHSNRVVAEAPFQVPGMLALDPGSDRLLVGRSMSAVNPPSTVGVLQRSDMSVEEIGVFFPRPHAIALHPARPLAYAASLAQNSMAVVWPEEEAAEVRPLPPVRGGTGVHTLVQWAVSPDGRWLVGTGEMSGRLLVFDLSDPENPRPHAQLPVGARPWHPVFSPDGGEVWFANKGANTVTVVSTGDWTVADVVVDDGLAEPHGIATSREGRWVYVSSNNLSGDDPDAVGTLTVIDRLARAVVAVLPVGANAAGVGTDARR